MDGPNLTPGSIPNSTSHSTTPSQPPSQNQSGVNTHNGQRYTPAPESTPASISIHKRTSKVQQGVLPQVNRERAITGLQSSYKTHYAQAEAKRDQQDLAYSLREIRHYLDNPALAKECTSYSIMWIPDEGEPVSVIPPGTELNDRAKANEIRGMLHGQLDKLDQKFTASKLQELEEEIVEQEGLMKLAGQQLQEMGAPVPKLPPRERIVLLGGSSNKMSSIPEQPSPHLDGQTSVAGQYTSRGTPTPPTGQPPAFDENSPLPGQFEIRFKTPVNSEDDDEEDDVTFSPAEEDELATRHLLPEGDDSFDEFDSTPEPPPFNFTNKSKQLDLPPPGSAIPRPTVTNPAPTNIGPLPMPGSEAETAPVVGPYSISYVHGQSGQPPAVFFSNYQFLEEPMASVNAGFDNETGTQFIRSLSRRGDVHEFGRFHRMLLEKCDPLSVYDATDEELTNSPGLAASRIFREDLNADGKNTGTVIIDVFKDKYPNGNPANNAIVYVIAPDAKDYDDSGRFLVDCEETAKRITWALHTYNKHVRELHEAGKGANLEEVRTLRTGVFSANQTKFPDVTPSEIAEKIVNGITFQLDEMDYEGEPRTIEQVELLDTNGVFSGVPLQNKPALQPMTTFEEEPISPPPPPTPSEMAVKLRECSPQLGEQLEANMGVHSNQAIRSVHNKVNWDKTIDQNPVHNGPLHTSRKAMLTRALTNFHRKHAPYDGVENKDAMFIPDSALPAIELGVLNARSSSRGVLNKAGSVAQYRHTYENLIQLNVPKATAKIIATAATGHQSDPDNNLLDSILRDVELLESQRTSSEFDINQLQTYQRHTSQEARDELRGLCWEYFKMIERQGDLSGAAGFVLKENGSEESDSSFARSLNPPLRNYEEKRDNLYVYQVNQLKTAANVPTSDSSLPSFGSSVSKLPLKRFGKLYSYSQNND